MQKFNYVMGRSGNLTVAFALAASMALSVAAGCMTELGESDDDTAMEEQALNGLFRIRARHSGMCLDVDGASSSNGARLMQHFCHNGNNQLFQLIELGNGFHRIRAYHSGKCLDVNGASASEDVLIVQHTCHGGTNQQFQIQPFTGGYYRIIARNSSKCFDIKYASMQPRANLVQHTCHSGYNQQFWFD